MCDPKDALLGLHQRFQRGLMLMRNEELSEEEITVRDTSGHIGDVLGCFMRPY